MATGYPLPPDFVSDDGDGDYTQATKKRPGERTCYEIFGHAADDRKASKKALSRHELTKQAPMTQYGVDLWSAYFTAFRQTLGVPETQTPTGDQIYRFIHTITKRITPRLKDKPVPSVGTIKVGLDYLFRYLTHQYADYAITKQEASRLDSLFKKLVAEGKLLQGKWRVSQYIGVATVQKMATAFLDNALGEGTLGWDVTLSRLTSVVIVAACGARSGDITKSNLYTGNEWLSWSDITIEFEVPKNGAATTVQHAKLALTMKWEKM